MDKMRALKKVHDQWLAECTCELRNQATQGVPGHGNPEADIVFIGEAPGKAEDEQGIPFVGAAGKFLDTMLAEIGLERKDIYITNVVKYRPPNNRDPWPEEEDACKEWLRDELEVIEPKLICFLGRHALNRFFPSERISQVHGKLIHKKFSNFVCEHFLPLYHPAAALYNGGMRETLLDDFKKLPKVLEIIKNKKTTE